MRSDVLNQNSGSYGMIPNVYKVSAKTADFTAAAGYVYVAASGTLTSPRFSPP